MLGQFLSWGESVKHQSRSVIEHDVNFADFFIGDGIEVRSLWGSTRGSGG